MNILNIIKFIMHVELQNKDENDILSKENISKIKSSKKEVTVNKYNDDNKIIYAFVVNGNKIPVGSENPSTHLGFCTIFLKSTYGKISTKNSPPEAHQI